MGDRSFWDVVYRGSLVLVRFYIKKIRIWVVTIFDFEEVVRNLVFFGEFVIFLNVGN